MISRSLYSLLCLTLLGSVASQLYQPAPQLSPADATLVINPSALSEHHTAGTGTPSLQHSTANANSADLFTPHQPPAAPSPPPAPVVIAAPPAPVPPRAPVMPYEYLGRMEDQGQMFIYLKKNENTYVTQVGETLDALYKVKRLDSQGVSLEYLPLRQEQRVPAKGE